jgi:hypothetical protein
MVPLVEIISALVSQPIAFVLALLTAVLVVVAVVNPTARLGARLLTIAIASISGITAWMIATAWQWPSDWPRLLR